MITGLAFFLVHALSTDPGERLYLSFERRIVASPSILVETTEGNYKFMGRRYRFEGPHKLIVCDGKSLYSADRDTKKVTRTRAPSGYPEDVYLRGFERIIKGSFAPKCTMGDKESFAGQMALALDTHYSESPMYSSTLYFDPKTKLPLGFVSLWKGEIETKATYTKVVLNAHLKASDFTIPKD
jgi:outer membrane lipoprotein-sorting protein